MLKKNLDVEGLYRDIEAIPKELLFLAKLTQVIWIKADEYLSPTEEKTCLEKNPPEIPPGTPPPFTQYKSNSFEYLMWTNSLISLCWLLKNVKNKCEHGQCHNPIHKEIQDRTGFTQCIIGSAKHLEFYDNIVNSLEELLEYEKEHCPTPIRSDQSKN
jgi:hypothetical protein